MTTVALIGPDGSGKTTIASRLQVELGVPAAYVYMGVNPDASTHQLPTTRIAWFVKRRLGGRPDVGPPPSPVSGAARPQGWRRVRREARTLARVANLMADEAYRSAVVRREERRGRVVLFDRHYFVDYHAHDIAGDGNRDLGRRLHGTFLRHVLRKPDLVVYLEAPAAELLRRKGEGTIEDLERRQRDYERALAELPAVVRVAADRPLDDVVADVRAAVMAQVAS
jgi:thymidylate kinase